MQERDGKSPRFVVGRACCATIVAVELLVALPACGKAPLCGLVAMGRLAFQEEGGAPDNSQREGWAHPELYAGLAINVKWADLQPAPGILRLAAVEDGLSEVDRYNRTHPRAPARAKLRVFAGPSAPDWVVAESGGPVRVETRNRVVSLPRFWTGPYRESWRRLQSALAAHFDHDPRVGEVAISSCATVTDEPFILPLGRDARAALDAAGLTDAAYRSCLEGAVDDYAAWKETPLDFTFNPYRAFQTGRVQADPDFALAVMRDFRQRLQDRAVLATHGLDQNIRPAAVPIYRELAHLGPPLALQFLAPTTDFDAALRENNFLRPTEIEVWQSREAGGSAEESGPQISGWRRYLSCRTP